MGVVVASNHDNICKNLATDATVQFLSNRWLSGVDGDSNDRCVSFFRRYHYHDDICVLTIIPYVLYKFQHYLNKIISA